MECLLKDHFKEGMDDLLACEKQWNNLLERVGKHINTHGSEPNKTVSQVPLDMIIYEGNRESSLGVASECKRRPILILLRHLA